MEYRPSLPEHNDNVSHNHPVREFAWLLSGLVLLFMGLFFVLGWLVDTAVEHISPAMEAAIFSSFDVSAAESQAGGNPATRQLQKLVDDLRGCAGIDYPLKVYLVDTEAANAMAFPGGRIAVFRGLLEKVRTENGLAFVLAHELAHYKNRDHLRGLGRGIVLTAMMAMLTGPDSGLTRLVAPAVSFGQARYSQGREIQADTLALEVLACRYGHAGGATEFFEAMTPEENGNKIGLYFASHPEAVARIENLHDLATELNLSSDECLPLPEVLVGGA
jgi:Zn-dependent protease with chaperone function